MFLMELLALNLDPNKLCRTQPQWFLLLTIKQIVLVQNLQPPLRVLMFIVGLYCVYKKKLGEVIFYWYCGREIGT
jgi:hypothetical protein